MTIPAEHQRIVAGAAATEGVPVMPTFSAPTLTFLRHPDGRMVALEPDEVLADDDPLVVEYPHLFATDEAPEAPEAPKPRARKK